MLHPIPSIQWLADGYKYTQPRMYYPGTKKIISYFESRGSDTFPDITHTVYMGMQYYKLQYLTGVVVTRDDVTACREFMAMFFGDDNVFNYDDWYYIVDTYGGKLPLEIRSVREGARVKLGNVLFTVTCTDERVFWLANFVETLLQQNWYPNTVATVSHEVKRIVTQAFMDSVPLEMHGAIDYVLNDFGARGVGAPEAGIVGGMAHLLNFRGTDNVAACRFAQLFYNGQGSVGNSVPATEHSITTLKGKAGEVKVFAHCMNIYPKGLLSYVGDGFDIFNFAKNIVGGQFKQQILERDGTIVLRPDSGDPVKTLLAIFEILFEQFGYTTYEGYRILPPQIRVIQGDGVNLASIKEIYKALDKAKISAINLVLGMGGALLQKVNRDDFKFALKCCFTEYEEDGKRFSYDVFKSPTEMNANGEIHESFKESKPGELKLILLDGDYVTVGKHDPEYTDFEDQLELILLNGESMKDYEFEEMREFLNNQVPYFEF